MKIYEKVVIDISTGIIEYEESYEYNGPISYCGNGGGGGGGGDSGYGGEGSAGPGNDGSEGYGGEGSAGPGNDGSEGYGGEGSAGPGNSGAEGYGGEGSAGPGNSGAEGYGGEGSAGPGYGGEGEGESGPASSSGPSSDEANAMHGQSAGQENEAATEPGEPSNTPSEQAQALAAQSQQAFSAQQSNTIMGYISQVVMALNPVIGLALYGAVQASNASLAAGNPPGNVADANANGPGAGGGGQQEGTTRPGGGLVSRGSSPQVYNTPAALPGDAQARLEERKKAAARRGRASTLLTGPQGITGRPVVEKKSLVGF